MFLSTPNSTAADALVDLAWFGGLTLGYALLWRVFGGAVDSSVWFTAPFVAGVLVFVGQYYRRKRRERAGRATHPPA